MNSGVDPTVTGRDGLFWRVWEQVRRRKATLATLGAMTGSQTLVALLSLVGAVIQAKYVDPKDLGYFAAFGILGGYLTFLHLGSLTALQREYPYWLGKGNPARAAEVASVVQGWNLMMCALTSLLYAALAVGCLVGGHWKAAAGWGTYTLLMGSSYYLLYLGCTYRSTSEFVTYSKISTGVALLSFLLLPVVAIWGFWGLCIRSAVPAAVNTMSLHRWRPVHVAPRLAWRPMWHLVKFGLPVDMAGFMANSCTIATMNAMIAGSQRYGIAVLGLFAFGRMGEGAVQQLALSITQVFIPRINHQMGATDNLRHCLVYSLKPTLVGVAAMAAVIVVASLACRPLIEWLTPAYVNGIPIVRVLMWAGIAPMVAMPGHVLLAARRAQPMIVANMAAFCVFSLIAGCALILKLPVIAIAWGYVAGKMAMALVLWAYLFVSLRPASAT